MFLKNFRAFCLAVYLVLFTMYFIEQRIALAQNSKTSEELTLEELTLEVNLRTVKLSLITACQGNDAKGCFLLGKFLEGQPIIDNSTINIPDSMKDISLSFSSYEKACSFEKKYCYQLGKIYELGQLGKSIDKTKARDFYEQACTTNTDDSCGLAASLRNPPKKSTVRLAALTIRRQS